MAFTGSGHRPYSFAVPLLVILLAVVDTTSVSDCPAKSGAESLLQSGSAMDSLGKKSNPEKPAEPSGEGERASKTSEKAVPGESPSAPPMEASWEDNFKRDNDNPLDAWLWAQQEKEEDKEENDAKENDQKKKEKTDETQAAEGKEEKDQKKPVKGTKPPNEENSVKEEKLAEEKKPATEETSAKEEKPATEENPPEADKPIKEDKPSKEEKPAQEEKPKEEEPSKEDKPEKEEREGNAEEEGEGKGGRKEEEKDPTQEEVDNDQEGGDDGEEEDDAEGADTDNAETETGEEDEEDDDNAAVEGTEKEEQRQDEGKKGAKGCTVSTSELNRQTMGVASVSEDGTECVFGADPRDEGKHCIYDAGKYGAMGWCFTDKNGGTWGSCTANCPLFGLHKVLAGRIDQMNSKIAGLSKQLSGLKGKSPSNTTDGPDEDTEPEGEGEGEEEGGETAAPEEGETADASNEKESEGPEVEEDKDEEESEKPSEEKEVKTKTNRKRDEAKLTLLGKKDDASGICADADGRRYSSFASREARTVAECKKLLPLLSAVAGIQGVQFNTISKECSVQVGKGVDPRGQEIPGGWSGFFLLAGTASGPVKAVLTQEDGGSAWRCTRQVSTKGDAPRAAAEAVASPPAPSAHGGHR